MNLIISNSDFLMLLALQKAMSQLSVELTAQPQTSATMNLFSTLERIFLAFQLGFDLTHLFFLYYNAICAKLYLVGWPSDCNI